MARVMVVDDVRFILQMMAGIFHEHGHDVLTAENGEQALETAAREPLDLVLLDIAMPGIDGIEVARRLRADPKTAAVPILMVTAQSDKKNTIAALEAGANDCLPKPFDTGVLLHKARKLLGSFRMNFSVEAIGGVPAITALAAELGEEHANELEQAIEAARTVAGTVVVDLSRVGKVDPSCAAALLKEIRDMKDEGRDLEVVRPGTGVGTRSLTSELESLARLHDSRDDALGALGLEAGDLVTERLGPLAGPPEAPREVAAVAPAPVAPDRPSRPAVLVESLGRTAMARVKADSFTQAFPELRAQVLPLAGQNVVLSMKGIASIDEHDAGELGALAGELAERGRTLRLSRAEPAVVRVLESAGLTDLLADRPSTEASS